ncbi:MAG: 2-oxoacid:acceptor oxidoreductase subunit alpha [Porphyromonas sp.]|nr:2-oxoacid:acceptor oxidoreductase subunit alpha [Porphyromonas sp.]
MNGQATVKDLRDVVIRFSGDSGDGMQLTGTIFTDLSAMLGNTISTFPDFPAEIRAPQGTLSGVSGFQVHIGANNVKAPGDETDVLVAMNPAALKVNTKMLKRDSLIIIDQDSFATNDLKKAEFVTEDPFAELGLATQQVIAAPITSMVKEGLAEFGLDNKSAVRCKNMFALGLICWLFERPLEHAEAFLTRKFGKKPELCKANIKALNDGFNFGANTHASTTTFRVETSDQAPGKYVDMNGNKATAYGLIAASEAAGRPLFLGSYPITPATDILHELSKHKALGIKTVQAEDEIAGICTAIGASFAGNLSVTTTSGPGLALKGEAMGLSVIAEIPLVIVDVQRAGPSTGMPTKSEQTDLMQALYGRNGESPMPVIAGTTPDNCFYAAYWAAKIAVEHMTPVILLTDSFIANGSSAFRIPDLSTLPEIKPPYLHNRPANEQAWKPYERNEETLVRYWAIPGEEGYQHRLGGLEKDYNTSVISTDADNHERMVQTRAEKVARIARDIPQLALEGDTDSDLLIVGWGGTYGHLYESMTAMQEAGHKVALAHFAFINPLPSNAEEILRRYKHVVVVEQNSGQFASYLRGLFPGFMPHQYNRVTGQPFTVSELVEAYKNILASK